MPGPGEPARTPGQRRDHPDREQQAERADRQVDQEDAAPAEALHQQPADHRAEGHGTGDDRRPQRHHPRPTARLREGGREQGQRTGHEQRRPRPLEQPRGHQQRAVRRRRAAERGHHEDDHPGQVQPLGPEQVRQRAGEQQQRREGERVSVHHPGQLGQPEVEPLLEGVAGDVHHGGVDRGHHEPGRERHQLHQAPTAAAFGLRCRRWVSGLPRFGYPLPLQAGRGDRAVRTAGSAVRRGRDRLADVVGGQARWLVRHGVLLPGPWGRSVRCPAQPILADVNVGL